MPANGDTVDELLAEYPPLSRENVMACLGFGNHSLRIRAYSSCDPIQNQ